MDDVITYFTINSSIENVRSSSSGGCSEREGNEAVRLRGFGQTMVSLCPDEALMKSERLRPELNLQNNGLRSSLVSSAASQELLYRDRKCWCSAALQDEPFLCPL